MKVKANAKVNLSLDVTGKRDDGYHTLCSVFQSVSLSDILNVELADEISVRCSDERLSGQDNLCFKATQVFFEAAGFSSGADIYIEKHIPEAAGLGGGSADAAATLVALNKLSGNPLSQEKLLEIALKLGADVPFCMLGGTKLCEGIGEIMTDLTCLPKCYIVVAKKGVKSSTGDMYRALDSDSDRRRPDTAAVLSGLKLGKLTDIFNGAYNCFESVSDGAALSEARTVAKRHLAVYCGLSGAGPSVISVFEDKENAEAAAFELAEADFLSFVTEPLENGVEINE